MKRTCWMLVALLSLTLAIPGLASAQVVKEENGSLDSLAFIHDRLNAQPALEPLDDVESALETEVRSGWAGFKSANGDWKAHVDKRNGRIESAEGQGVPFVPGRGNSLKNEDIDSHLKGKKKPDLSTLESISRSFLPKVAHLLGVDVKSLRLEAERSGNPIDYLWYLDYNVEIDGLAVEGARVVFRVNHGNLIQFGGREPARPERPRPQGAADARAGAERARGLHRRLPGRRTRSSTAARYSLLPVAASDSRFNEGFEFGKGRGLATAWQFTFRRDGEHATWRGRVDAVTGEVLELHDTNDYASATGGVKFLGVPASLPDAVHQPVVGRLHQLRRRLHLWRRRRHVDPRRPVRADLGHLRRDLA